MKVKRIRRPECPQCLGRYDLTKPAKDGTPRFKCSNCNHVWSCGPDGGHYMESLKVYSDPVAPPPSLLKSIFTRIRTICTI